MDAIRRRTVNKEMFESSEFYSRRYDNFSTLVIIPIFLLVVGLLVFSLFGKREVTVKTIGEIEPAGTISQVQSASGERIITNNLKENKTVHKGDVLLTYDDGQNAAQLSALQQQLDTVKRQQTAAGQLKTSLINHSNTFTAPDEFGYSSTLDDYNAQVAVIQKDDNRDNETTQNQNQAVTSTKSAVEQQINQNQDRIDDYNELKQTVDTGATLPGDNVFTDTYQLYATQLGAADPSQRGSITSQLLSEIESSVQELSQTNSSLTAQETSASLTTPTTNTSSKINELNAQYLLNADKELSSASSTQLELETKITLAKSQDDKATVKAEHTGLLHVNEDIKGLDTIPAGTVVAQIYPKLDDATKLDIVLDIPTENIDSIHAGQTVRLSSYQNSAKPLVITGKVATIATSPTRTKQGNYYEIHARASTDHAQNDRIRYGFEGTSVIITGSKTFFNYYKDKLLHS